MAIQFSRRGALMTGGAIFVAGCTQAPKTIPLSDIDSWVPNEAQDAQIRSAMEKFQVPGVGIAVIEDGAVDWNGN